MKIYLMTVLAVCGIVLLLAGAASAIDHLVSNIGVTEQQEFPQ